MSQRPPAPRSTYRETTFDHGTGLITWMSLTGLASTLVLAGLLAAGAGMTIAGAASAVVGLVAMGVLIGMAVAGNSSVSAQQGALRTALAGLMLAVWGTWNACVGLLPLAYGLFEAENWLVAILGGVLVLVGGVLGIVGSVQRVIGRRRAGLPDDEYVPSALGT